MNESQIASTLSGAKTSTLAFLTAHPVGVAVVGGLIAGLGAYYISKAIIARRAKKTEAPKKDEAPAPVEAAAAPAAA